MKSNPVFKTRLEKVLEFEKKTCVLESESRVLEIGRTKLKPPTPEEDEPPKIKFVVLQKPRLEALFTGKNCTTLIKFLKITSLIFTQKIMITSCQTWFFRFAVNYRPRGGVHMCSAYPRVFTLKKI
jgi:hypothetical protein